MRLTHCSTASADVGASVYHGCDDAGDVDGGVLRAQGQGVDGDAGGQLKARRLRRWHGLFAPGVSGERDDDGQRRREPTAAHELRCQARRCSGPMAHLTRRRRRGSRARCQPGAIGGGGGGGGGVLTSRRTDDDNVAVSSFSSGQSSTSQRMRPTRPGSMSLA